MKAKNSALLSILIAAIFFVSCNKERKDGNSFTVAFFTDIHLQPEDNAVTGFQQALDSVRKQKPDFILTGGDLIMDALEQTYGRADSFYNLYMETADQAGVKFYNTMGNHEIYGIYRNSGADPAHEEYGEKMFEKRLGPSYYSFDHKGWKFMIINSVEDTKKGGYTGQVDSIQMTWIRNELTQTDTTTPIVLSTHIPFITAFTQRYNGPTAATDSSLVVFNSKEVLDLFKGHNLKLVLQGHLHTIEDVHIDGIHFITGGAVCGAWWNGPHMGFEEGFILLTFRENDFSWRYVDYGWKAE